MFDPFMHVYGVRSLTPAGPDRFPLTTTARTTKQALAFGLVFGGLQDALALARGQSIGYVDFVRRRLGRSGTTSPTPEKT